MVRMWFTYRTSIVSVLRDVSRHSKVFSCSKNWSRNLCRINSRKFVSIESQTLSTQFNNTLVGRCKVHDFSNDRYVNEILSEVTKDLLSESQTVEEDHQDHHATVEAAVLNDDEHTTMTENDDYEDFMEDNVVHEEVVQKVHPISLERGSEGVFDVEEVVVVLREENAMDICTIHVPEERNYVDYLVIVTGRSKRHLVAMAQYIRKLYKLKRSSDDPGTVNIEGKQTTDWLALDLGNVAVHLFLEGTRRLYDIESLWTLGEDFDGSLAELDQSDPYSFLFEERGQNPIRQKESESEDGIESENETPAVEIHSFASHSDKWHGGGS